LERTLESPQSPQSQGCVERANVVKENNILDEDDWPGNVEEIYETPAEKAPFDLLDLGDELDTPGVLPVHKTKFSQV
ncbi:unnamed protein product, partial [Didymodactylos carnosus]